MNHLTEAVKTQIAITAAEGVAAATALYGGTLDCAGFDGLRMCVVFGVLTTAGTLSIKAQQAALANFSDPVDLAGTAISVNVDADDGYMFIIDIQGIRKRYARLAVMRAAQNSVVQLAWYELYHPKELPVTQHANVKTLEQHVSPIEGTA